MWLHGMGWLLPKAIEVVGLCVLRNGQHLHSGLLKPCRNHPLSLQRAHCFRQLLFTSPACPMHERGAGLGPPPQRHLPPTGLQLWPGHSLHLSLRLAWQCAYRPAAAHWPRDWSAHLRTWHMQPCPYQLFQWKTSPWTLACPVVFKPVQVCYHAISGHAVWTFELKER